MPIRADGIFRKRLRHFIELARVAGSSLGLQCELGKDLGFTLPAMDDTADTAQIVIRPPLAWGLAVIAGRDARAIHRPASSVLLCASAHSVGRAEPRSAPRRAEQCVPARRGRAQSL